MTSVTGKGKLRVGVLFGGVSGEHDVSLCSAASVVSSLDRDRYDIVAVGIDRDGRWYVQDEPVIVEDRDFGRIMKMVKKGKWLCSHFNQGGRLVMNNCEDGTAVDVDVVFPVVHGTNCEDGTLQGLLELSGVPYVGADVTGSSVGMDKDITKKLLRDAGIPVVPWITLTRGDLENYSDTLTERTVDELGDTLFVKPVCAGSSVGVNRVCSAGELFPALRDSFRYDNRVLVEKAVDAREIECAVIGNFTPEASVTGEVIPSHEFYSYEAKYIDPEGARLEIPADIPDNISESIRDTAVRAFGILNCRGMARVDFFLERNGSAFYLNEINTLPGFTSISMYPKLWEHTGVKYGQLLDRLISLAMEYHAQRSAIKTEL